MTSTAVAAAVTIAACSSKKSGESPTTPTGSVTSVAVTGNAPTIGLTTQLTATATLSTGATQNVTSQATWQSSNTAIATVNSAGVVTGMSAGDVDITATYQAVAGRARITVAPTTYTVSGAVTDGTSGGVLPNINIQILSGANAGISTRTDAAGAYSFAAVVPGALTLSASAVSYQTLEKAVTVVGNTRVDFVLQRAPGCAYTLSPTAQNVPASGGSFSLTATSNTSDPSCTWSASTTTPWITVGATAGTSPSTITFTAAANPTAAVRSGTIRVSWSGGFADSTITQSAGTCSFVLNPQSNTVPAAGGNFAFTVTPSDNSCAWTATADVTWISVASAQSGTGVGTVSYAVQSYAGSTPRLGNIVITGLVSGLRGFPVTQNP
jgi:trimeric autotransporter adhesin